VRKLGNGGAKVELTAANRLSVERPAPSSETSTVKFAAVQPRITDWLVEPISLRSTASAIELWNVQSRKLIAPALLTVMNADAEFANASALSPARPVGANEIRESATSTVPAQSMCAALAFLLASDVNLYVPRVS
jgi:hypothetical protein